MKGVDLDQAKLLIANAAVKSLRLLRAPMADAWHLVLTCPAGTYVLLAAENTPSAFPTADDALKVLLQEGVQIVSVVLESKQ